jgi:hypothetical protein
MEAGGAGAGIDLSKVIHISTKRFDVSAAISAIFSDLCSTRTLAELGSCGKALTRRKIMFRPPVTATFCSGSPAIYQLATLSGKGLEGWRTWHEQ